jgi:hypothetical protein
MNNIDWISVSDDMPQPGLSILVCYTKGPSRRGEAGRFITQGVLVYCDWREAYQWEDYTNRLLEVIGAPHAKNKVTHFAILPELP